MSKAPVEQQAPTAESAHAALAARRQAFAWALYDWGNSAFATTVMAGFFPLFFKLYWSAGADVAQSTFYLALANSVASFAVAVVAPVLGAHTDRSLGKKRWLAGFAAIGCIGTAGLAFVGQGEFPTASLLYVLAMLGFSGSLVFYDALLLSVASPADSDRVSSLGYGLGYLGGGVLFLLNVLMFVKPRLFGLADGPAAVRASFVTVAVWWAVFTVPLVLRVRERGSPAPRAGVSAVSRALADTVKTLRRLRSMPELTGFLVAYFLYIDGVGTIQKMAVDYGLALGLPSQSLMTALLIVQLVGFPAAILFGRLAGRIGTRRAILLGIGIYVAITLLGAAMRTARDFYVLAILVGLAQGGVQALSRSFYSRLVPPNESGEFFGFYNMLGRFSAVLGPMLMGVTGLVTGSPRLSIVSVAVLLIAGGVLLARVPEPAAHAPREVTP